MNNLTINLTDLVLSFTTAMDSVSSELQNHNKRVCNMAVNIAYQMGLPEEEIFDILIASRLHDIGALSVTEQKLLTSLSYDTNYAHAAIGHKILSDFGYFKNIAEIILHHHRTWKNGTNKFDSMGSEIPMGSWIIHLADKIDFLVGRKEYPLYYKDVACEMILKHNGKIFNPNVTEAFLTLADKEYFWFDINFQDTYLKHKELINKYSKILQGDSILDMGYTFSRIIDFRNKFTSTHSIGVATTAEAISKVASFDQNLCKKMKLAGFLHDLGKIVIPISILEKDGPLTMEERLVINSHTYYTFNILATVKGLEEINRWASYHHEKLDGTGYPFHLTGENLDTMSRIMMIADIFTALREDRPYRNGMERQKVENIINEWSNQGKLDKDISDLLFANYKEIDDCRANAQYLANNSYEQALKQ